MKTTTAASLRGFCSSRHRVVGRWELRNKHYRKRLLGNRFPLLISVSWLTPNRSSINGPRVGPFVSLNHLFRISLYGFVMASILDTRKRLS